MKLSYCGFYCWHVVVAGYGDSMVAVHDEVGVPNLVELDRRQVLASLERPVYALPPLPQACPRGQKGSVKVPPPPHAANDLSDLYNPPPSVSAVVSDKLSSYVVEGEQPVRGVPFSSKTGHYRPQASPAPSTDEVYVHLLVEVHVWDHLPSFSK